jgi:hypothetical protein
VFTGKHHGGSLAGDATWASEVSRNEEFSVFEEGVAAEVEDEDGNFFGVLRGEDGELRDLGTKKQQIAIFPFTSEGTPWHGYPQWSLEDADAPNRSIQKMRPAKRVFDRLKAARMLHETEVRRLWRGRHV